MHVSVGLFIKGGAKGAYQDLNKLREKLGRCNLMTESES